MGFFDLVSLILDNLSRRKARVALTAIGVVIGTAAVIILVSLGFGLQRSATSNLYGISDLARIDVYPFYGEAVAVDIGPGQLPEGPKLLTKDAVDEIAAIPGVILVSPRDYLYGEAIMKFGKLEAWAGLTGVGGLEDLSDMGWEAVYGSLVLNRKGIIIGEQVPSSFFDPNYRPGQEMPQPPDLSGQTVRVTLRKYDAEGNTITRTLQMPVVGIIKSAGGEQDYSIFMPIDVVTQYNEWFTGKRINRSKDPYSNLVIRVEDPSMVTEITEQIKNLGYEAYSSQSYVEGINSFFVILQIIFGGVGATALLVAAIGIANTMTMAILERTREIGLMKALGATNRDVLSVFLGEAAGIGFLGGLGGVILGWSGGQIINVLAISYLAGQAAQQGGPPPSEAVLTPLWLPVSSLIFATLIGLISGLYPALRAATLVPINALKYE
jgi:putative ABC transport system permease protein